MNLVRLNKIVAKRSCLSRREADRAIKNGRVRIKNKIEKNPAVKVEPNEKIFLDGTLLKKPKKRFTVIIYNKPKGELVTKKDDRGRKTIYDTLPNKYKSFIPVGRLDYASEGLLLLTDSAGVSEALMTSNLTRVYNIKIDGLITEEIIKAAKEGMEIQDASRGAHKKTKIISMRFAPFAEIKVIKNSKSYSKLKISIKEGKNREIRRFFGYFNRKVLDLKRVSYGWINLNALPEKKIRYLEKNEYNMLHEFLNSKQEEK